ncbi:MAG TPA: DnaJ domain-containing protein [Polyangiaceae bacterium]
MIRILLVALLVVALVYAYRGFQRMDPSARRRATRFGLYGLGGLVVITLLTRSGLHWLGVIGAAAWAVVRAVIPLALRLLPLAGHLRHGRPDARAEDARANEPENTTRTVMSRSEALEVLGLREGATREEILFAYRNLIRKVHPDSPGGSTYLASKLNQAKEVLLA